MTTLEDYQHEDVQYRKALRALRMTAKTPGRPDATEQQQERYRDIAVHHLETITERKKQR